MIAMGSRPASSVCKLINPQLVGHEIDETLSKRDLEREPAELFASRHSQLDTPAGDLAPNLSFPIRPLLN